MRSPKGPLPVSACSAFRIQHLCQETLRHHYKGPHPGAQPVDSLGSNPIPNGPVTSVPLATSVDLLDLDPVPVEVKRGHQLGGRTPAFGYKGETSTCGNPPMPIGQVLSPEASHSSPFRQIGPAVDVISPPAPRTPKVGTTIAGHACTPGGTRVPDSPPPPTPPLCGASASTGSPPGMGLGPLGSMGMPSSPIPPSIQCSSGGAGVSGQVSGVHSEEPTRLVYNLPTLEVYDGSSDASVTTGDWIARIGPVMRSLSPGASQWWGTVMQTTTEFYQRWLQADALQRLGIKSEAISQVAEYGPP